MYDTLYLLILIEFDNTGVFEWTKSFGNSTADRITSVCSTLDAGYMVGGYFSSDSLTIGEEILNNSGSKDGFVIKFNYNDEIEWVKKIGEEGNDSIESVSETIDGGFVIGGSYGSNITINDCIISGTRIIMKYNQNGYINGIIKCYCGFGKTFCAIYLACKLGLKTLFIVDKDSLYKQWVGEIAKFTDLDPENVGIIKGDVFKTDDNPFTIAMVQTMVSKVKKQPREFYEKMRDAGFGLIIFDEVHNTSASEKYSKISVMLSAPNIIGLSATPFKSGEQGILMKNVIGNILYDEKSYKNKPKISFHYYKSGLQKYNALIMRLDYIQSKAYYNKIIVNSPNYLNLIIKYVKHDLKDQHKIIIVCSTEKQVISISDKLTEEGIENRKFYGKEREFSHDDNVLIVTYKFAGTGFDFKELSSLIYACPLSGRVSLIQTAGRVLRECQGKQAPVIRFLSDLSFPGYFLTEVQRGKKVFKNEFSNDVIIEDIEEEEFKHPEPVEIKKENK